MRKAALLTAACLWLAALSACGSGGAEEPELGAGEIAARIVAAFAPEELPDMQVYLSGAEEGGDGYLEAGYAGLLFTGRYGEVPELSLAAEYALYTPLGHRAFEVDVLKAADLSGTEALRSLLSQRLERKDDGDLRLYAPLEMPLLDGAEIISAGRFVILLATSDNQKARTAVGELFGTGVSGTAPPETEPSVTPPPEIDAEGVRVAGSRKIFDLDSLALGEPKGLPLELQCAVPEITVHMYSHNDMYLIGGRCEVGAVIHVSGGVRELVSKSDYSDFLVEVPIDTESPSVLKLSARVEGKEASDEITLIVRPQENVRIFEEKGIYGTIVGLDYQCVFQDGVPDYEGTNLLSETEIEALVKRTSDKISALRDAACDAEILYLLVPNPMNIYPELMPPTFIRYSENSLTKQFTGAVTEAGATVIDLSDVMNAHRDDPYKIYHKTDSHWTEYGALLGYNTLMDYIGQRFPDARPRPMSDFTVYNRQMALGDIYMMLGLARDSLFETTAFVDFAFDPPGGHPYIYMGANVSIDHEVVGRAHTTRTNLEGEFPSAYIFRDSFGGPIHAFLSDRFANATWHAWGQYNFNAETIAAANPDYVIYIITERNIRNVLF